MFGSMFSIELGGFFQSPECVADLQPINKWAVALALPWGVAIFFLIWYKGMQYYFRSNNDYDEAVDQTILQASVQVCLIGLYTTVVRTSFKIADCTTETHDQASILIMDPRILCDEAMGYQVLAFVAFGLWNCVPFLALTFQLCRYHRRGIGVLERRMEESMEFNIMYGWAVKKYRTNSHVAYLWEVVNASIKILMVAGSELMYADNRTILHSSVVGVSLILHAIVRPYKDKSANYLVCLFCLIDLLGVFSKGSAIMQGFFLFCALITLLLVLFLLSKTARSVSKGHKDKEKQLKHHTVSFTHLRDEYTDLELKLLCPILIVVMPAQFLASLLQHCLWKISRCCCKNKKQASGVMGAATKIKVVCTEQSDLEPRSWSSSKEK